MIMMVQLLGKGKKMEKLPQRTPENEDTQGSGDEMSVHDGSGIC